LPSVVYSRHAEERLALRGVTKRQVSATIHHPDDLYQDVQASTSVAVKRTKNKHLIVVYTSPDEKRSHVVTVYYASNVDGLVRGKSEEASGGRGFEAEL